MTDIAIHVENMGKRYRIGHAQRQHDTLRDALADAVKHFNVRSFKRSNVDDTIWALKDVSFEIKQGEVVGIIGRNGAGKSTLLKILSRITKPTEGWADIHGRVGSLLEVGTGFHPELTGRENIYLNGAIIGMKKVDIDRKFDEIVAFAEVEKFIDTPVKHFSSGMYVRLAFAVAAHLEPEILLVDEVLAVGDVAFQKKCLGKMEDVAKEGRTVMFVSHNMGAVATLCPSAILFDQGSIVMQGNSSKTIATYFQGNNRSYSPIPHGGAVKEAHEIKLIGGKVLQGNLDTNVINCRQPFTVEIDYEILSVVPRSRFFLIFRNERGEAIFGTSDYDDPAPAALNRQTGKFRSRIEVPGNFLKTGTIYGTVGADVKGERILVSAEEFFQIEVIDAGFDTVDTLSERHQRVGIIAPLLHWTTSSSSDERSH